MAPSCKPCATGCGEDIALRPSGSGKACIHLRLDVYYRGMSEYKCPFSPVQASGSCHCRHAQEVVRRGGSEFDCREPAAHSLCTVLVGHLNRAALPALGYEDDLTLTPKSVYERILIGGLQGLGMALDAEDREPQTADIWTVVAAVRERYPAMDRIPAADFLPAIEACNLRKRHRRRH
jgi:hypothetical protein